MKTLIPVLTFITLASSCSVSKNYNPVKKFGPDQLQEDYQLFRNILEETHPSLYWYTSKDSIDYYFEAGKQKLNDSLTEGKFRYVLSYVLSKIRCGHTSVRASKGASKFSDRVRGMVQFPISIKAWDDTVVVTSNLSRRDSSITRGTVLKSIDGRPVETIIDSFFQHLSTDGYNTTHKFQAISNASVFRNMYAAIFGLKTRTPVEYLDSTGKLVAGNVTIYIPVIDSNRKRTPPTVPQLSKKDRKKLAVQAMRSFRIDTSLNAGFMEVNSFTKHFALRKFFRQSFREMRKENVRHLVVDMRGNGGGNVTLSNLLTKYIADKPFKIADSLYAVSNRSRYKKHFNEYFLNRLFFIFMVRQREPGRYHFKYFENKYFKPKQKNHFSGDTYILTGGNTFSAASLFTKAVKDQPEVTVVGEETGGGAYGNTAWLIPDVTLPNTKVRFRLPLFRLVVDKNETKGNGILPEVEAKPTAEAIRRNEDFKMKKAIELIRQKNRNIVQHKSDG